MKELQLIQRARQHGRAVALRSGDRAHTYSDLLIRSKNIAAALLNGLTDLDQKHVAFLAPAGVDYIAIQWGIWRAGGVAVPLCMSAAPKELEYALSDSKTTCVIVTQECAEKVSCLCDGLNLPLIMVDDAEGTDACTLPEIAYDRRAMILYTSGTTSKPKGVVTTHANLNAHIETLVAAWEWESADSIPLFLPLHHVHGIINVMSCALWSGAVIEPFPHFDLKAILNRVSDHAYSVFMAVPTIYVKLIEALEALPATDRAAAINGFADMRLMVSGSAALPARVHEEWTSLTGQKLLERYGMTELGMALSNPYRGERRPGAVGQPLPGVEIRLKADSGEIVGEENVSGEIQVRGPGVFLEYWDRPEATAESFDEGWFRTGDVAVLETGYYRIMGRQSVDIIKSGGYKLSALEIESTLLDHPAIADCAVVGVQDDTWGEAVAVACALQGSETMDIKSLREWCKERMSAYKIPKHLLTVGALPRNAMGKVTKPAVRDLFLAS